MTEPTGQKDRAGGLKELSDPEFFTRWAVVRDRLAHTPPGKPRHGEMKRDYETVSAEYRRRMAGGLSATDTGD